MILQNTILKSVSLTLLLIALLITIPTILMADTESIGNSFSYQGQLVLNGNPVNDRCDLTFALHDAVTAGNQVGSTLTKSNVAVANGLFTVELDFGANAFTGDSRWLEIAVQCSGEASFTTLAPRQALNPTPYAIYADEAGTMSFNNLSGVPSGLADGDNDTTYSASTGLELSGSAFSITDTYRLPQSCSNNQVAKWNGSAWTCANDSDSDTTYSAGTGLELSGSSFSISDTHRLPQSCSNNQVPKWDGSAWACADDVDTNTDTNTTYSASTGLELSGSAFSITNTYRLPQSCSNNEVPKWNGSAWACAADENSTSYTAGDGLTLSGNEFSANFGTAANTTAEGNHTHPASDIASGTLDDARLSADVTHRNVAETISENWDNSANPWADNEVADNLTISGGTIDNSVIGATTPAAANVTDLSANGNSTLGDASSDQITVNGALKITSGSPGAGKVLTSDADGDATWEDAPSAQIQQVINVAISGGDYTSIQAALNSISDASATKPYLIRVAPGVYEEQVTMIAYVDIEGAGQNQTIIKYSDTSSASEIYALKGSDNAELRFISVVCEANASKTNAIYNTSSSPSLIHVTATASGGTQNRGIYNISSSSPTMTHVTASASGGTHSYGILNNGSSPTMQHVTATASGGTSNNYGIRNDNASSPIMKDVSGTAFGSGGTNTSNYGIFNDSSSSPTMNYITANASEGTDTNIALYNRNSSPTLNDITASASGGINSYGVYNINGSSPVMKDITATASDATNNYGVYNNGSSPTMNHITVSASGGTSSQGIYNTTASAPTISASQVRGATNSIFNSSNSSAKVANSMLDGAVSGGTFTCFGLYDANFAALTCP